MRIVACRYDEHAQAILAILNDAIVTSTALFDYRPREQKSMVEWFRAKELARFPVLGAVADDGSLKGFATYGPFRNWPAYKYAIERCSSEVSCVTIPIAARRLSCVACAMS